MVKVEITQDEELRDKAFDVMKRARGSNSDEIRRKITNLSDQDRECIIKYFDIDTEELESIVISFWLEMVKPILDVFPGISSESFQ
ncbi:MAG: hypothetical protein FVQ85_01050 [Planctomycetes bacterium]|nr:hypothetical protein [Planctomycetota bacterium]